MSLLGADTFQLSSRNMRVPLIIRFTTDRREHDNNSITECSVSD